MVVVPFSQQYKVSVTSFSPLNMFSLLGCGVVGEGEVRGGGVRGGIFTDIHLWGGRDWQGRGRGL